MKGFASFTLLALLVLAGCVADQQQPTAPPVDSSELLRELDSLGFLESVPAAEAMAEQPRAMAVAAEPNLFEIELPAGNTGSINIGWFPTTRTGATMYDAKSWISQGYDGVRFKGQGVEQTHLRCTSWDGITLAVGQHNGIVELRDLTLHSGSVQGTAFGEQNTAKRISPRFQLRLINVHAVVDHPSSYTDSLNPNGRRAKWLIFGYQMDFFAQRCIFDSREAVEHSVYIHGFAATGAQVEDCVFLASGAEGFKVRSDTTETAWAGPLTKVVLRNSTFENWRQPWSWRGGAGVVLQGCAAHVLVERCIFTGGTPAPDVNLNERSHALMVSSEAQSYDQKTGTPNTGFGTGFVIVRECQFYGKSMFDWNNSIMQCQRNTGTQQAARGFLMESSGVWGPRMVLALNHMPVGMTLVRNCNTSSLASHARSVGIDSSVQATIPTATRKIPVSEGFAR